MGYVSDVDLQLEIVVGKQADVDGIVEVTGGFAVDGYDGQIAEVAAALEFARRNRGEDALRFFERGCREKMGEMEFADDDFYVDAEIILAAQDLDHLAAGVLRGARPVGDFYVDYDAFEVGPVGTSGGFFAQDAVARLGLPW